MGHLLIVANLTSAIGGRPHFTRPNFPVRTGYFPSALVLRLTPFSFDTLDHFIFLERPRGVETEDGAGFESSDHERAQAHQGLMPSAQDYTTVGHLYEAIRANLIAFSQRSGEEGLFCGPESDQIGPDILPFNGIEIIRNLEAADRAIDLIVQQGEGSKAERADSHFSRFQAVKREYETLLSENPLFAPAHPVAENPIMRRISDPEDTVFVDAQPAAMLLDFANAVYGMLLRFLVQAYTKSGEQKELMLSSAIDLMHVMDTAAKVSVKFPATREPGINAGMTFTMLRGVEPFIPGPSERVLIFERLNQIRSGARRAVRLVPELRRAVERLDALTARFDPAI
jgi:hypothetical protein